MQDTRFLNPRGLDRSHDGKKGHKSFTSGWKSGWNNQIDRRGPLNLSTQDMIDADIPVYEPEVFEDVITRRPEGGSPMSTQEMIDAGIPIYEPEVFMDEHGSLGPPLDAAMAGIPNPFADRHNQLPVGYDDQQASPAIVNYNNTGTNIPANAYPAGGPLMDLNFDSDREALEEWRQQQEGPTIMTPLGGGLAMAGKRKRTLATVPGSRTAPSVLEPYGLSDDIFKQDPYRTYNHGYRYNNYGLQPLYFG
jgi:hypothetical protein